MNRLRPSPDSTRAHRSCPAASSTLRRSASPPSPRRGRSRLMHSETSLAESGRWKARVQGEIFLEIEFCVVRLLIEEVQHCGLFGGRVMPEQGAGGPADKQAGLFEGARPQGGIERGVVNQADQL